MIHESHPEAHALYDLATAFDSIREHLPIPGHPERAPTLEAASYQLDDFTVLLAELSDEVGTRSAEQSPTAEHRRTAFALTSAAASAGRAVREFTAVYEQLGFHHQFAAHPDHPDLRDARQAANQVIEERLGNTRDALIETSHRLHKRADELTHGTSPRAAAARARTASPVTPHTAPSPSTPPPGSAPLDRSSGPGR